jgi:hypothetical protein
MSFFNTNWLFYVSVSSPDHEIGRLGTLAGGNNHTVWSSLLDGGQLMGKKLESVKNVKIRELLGSFCGELP